MEIQEILKGIDEAASLEELAAKFWPNSYNEKYLFISYSHLDYKPVFKDLVMLNTCDVNVWYDRSLVPSRNWELDAEQFMVNYNCIGVVFYLSINSLSSNSVYKEMQKAKQWKKPYVAILIGNGEKSIMDLYKKLPENKKSPEKESTLRELFGAEDIFLNIEQEASQKTEKIRSAFSQKPLYNYEVSIKRTHSNDPEYSPLPLTFIEGYKSKYKIKIENDRAAIVSVNNIDILHADDIAEVVEINNKHYPVSKIDNCAFANCMKLKTIKFPQTMQLIKTSVFQNCISLEEAVLPEGVLILKSSVFAGCLSLKTVYLPSTLREIRSWCFAGCHSLREIFIPKSVSVLEENVFDGLKNILIKCEADGPQPGWSPRFNPDNAKVIYGAKR